MGIETTDNFDDFVKELNSLGLDKITEEVNEWYAVSNHERELGIKDVRVHTT